jgi:TonB family protein
VDSRAWPSGKRGVVAAVVALGCLAVLVIGAIVAVAVVWYGRSRVEEGVLETTAAPAPPGPIEEIAAEEIAPADAESGGEPVESAVEAQGKAQRPKPKAGKGELDEGEIKKVISKNLGRFRYCYDRELHPSPTLKGKVVVRFVIAPSGNVTKASIASSSLGNKNVEACVLKVAGSLVFPKPEGGSVVASYPLVFAPAAK